MFEQIPVTDAQFDVEQKHLSRLTEVIKLLMEDYKNHKSKPNITIKFVLKFQMTNPTLALVEKIISRRWASENGFILSSHQKIMSLIMQLLLLTQNAHTLLSIIAC